MTEKSKQKKPKKKIIAYLVLIVGGVILADVLWNSWQGYVLTKIARMNVVVSQYDDGSYMKFASGKRTIQIETEVGIINIGKSPAINIEPVSYIKILFNNNEYKGELLSSSGLPHNLSPEREFFFSNTYAVMIAEDIQDEMFNGLKNGEVPVILEVVVKYKDTQVAEERIMAALFRLKRKEVETLRFEVGLDTTASSI